MGSHEPGSWEAVHALEAFVVDVYGRIPECQIREYQKCAHPGPAVAEDWKCRGQACAVAAGAFAGRVEVVEHPL